MRLTMHIAIATAALLAGPAMAMPNVFWTFGFQLPAVREQAPRFGAVVTPSQPALVAIASPAPTVAAEPIRISWDRGDVALLAPERPN